MLLESAGDGDTVHVEAVVTVVVVGGGRVIPAVVVVAVKVLFLTLPLNTGLFPTPN